MPMNIQVDSTINLKKYIKRKVLILKKVLFELEDYEGICHSYQEEVKAFHVRKEMVDECFNETEWYNEVFTELERRKTLNAEILRYCGLDL